jgi:hypothetical protein
VAWLSGHSYAAPTQFEPLSFLTIGRMLLSAIATHGSEVGVCES